MAVNHPAQQKPLDWTPDDDFLPLTDEKVVGLNNLLSIAWLSRALELAAAVCRVIVGPATGTGFLIGTDLLMTNNHVIPNEVAAATAIAEFNYQTNWAGVPQPVRRFTLDTSHFRTNEKLDYTMIRVKDSPGDLFGFVDVGMRARPAVNDYVSIIQHPNGGPKQIALTDNKVANVFGDLVQYTTDTEPGSSGSSVFSQAWELVALHHRGGRLAGPDGTRYFTNEGVLVSSIVLDAADFLGLPDTLYGLAFGELRSALVRSVELAQPGPRELAANLLRTQPQLSYAIEEWAGRHGLPGEAMPASLMRAGIAIGAALRHWSRTAGHESISTTTTPTPPPDQRLIDAVAASHRPNDLPAAVYAAVVAALAHDPTLAPSPPSDQVDLAAAAGSCVAGVALGASAYDGTRPPPSPPPPAG
jgi:endonuclease G